MGASHNLVPFGGPYNKDFIFLGSRFGFPIFWQLPYRV